MVFSTYLGGSDWDEGRGIAIDNSENVYITGHTGSMDFTTLRPLQKEYAGDTDAFLAKIDRNGKLCYSTYLGGKSFDSGNSLAVDEKGNVFVTGQTGSKEFPVRNPIQNGYAGESDIFLTKINPEGKILFSTFLGGDSLDNGRYLSLDPEGDIYITGITKSKGFPVRKSMQKINGGRGDAFVIKIDHGGKRILYSTLLGGSSYDSGSGIAIGLDESIYIGGTTESKNFPEGDLIIKEKINCPYAFVTKIKQNIKVGNSKDGIIGHDSKRISKKYETHMPTSRHKRR
jgi:hypothetical protein